MLKVTVWRAMVLGAVTGRKTAMPTAAYPLGWIRSRDGGLDAWVTSIGPRYRISPPTVISSCRPFTASLNSGFGRPSGPTAGVNPPADGRKSIGFVPPLTKSRVRSYLPLGPIAIGAGVPGPAPPVPEDDALALLKMPGKLVMTGCPGTATKVEKSTTARAVGDGPPARVGVGVGVSVGVTVGVMVTVVVGENAEVGEIPVVGDTATVGATDGVGGTLDVGVATGAVTDGRIGTVGVVRATLGLGETRSAVADGIAVGGTVDEGATVMVGTGLFVTTAIGVAVTWGTGVALGAGLLVGGAAGAVGETLPPRGVLVPTGFVGAVVGVAASATGVLVGGGVWVGGRAAGVGGGPVPRVGITMSPWFPPAFAACS